jgi:hypothetical protein
MKARPIAGPFSLLPEHASGRDGVIGNIGVGLKF